MLFYKSQYYVYIIPAEEEYNPSSPASLCSNMLFLRLFLCTSWFSPLLSLVTAQAPGDPSYEEPAEEDRGPRGGHGRGAYSGQQIHGAQHRGAGAAVGPAGPARDEDAAQPGAADSGSVLSTPRV